MISNELLKKKILDEAIRGRLIENDLSLPPADVEESTDNIPFEIPNNWKWVEIKNVVNMASGGTPSRNIKEYWENGNIPWVKISDMKEKYLNSTDEFITNDGLKNSSAKIFPKGTILYSIFATIGNVSILNIDASTNQAIVGLTPKVKIDINFLYFILKHIKDFINQLGKGTSQLNINQQVLKKTLIPLPPLEEQEKIVKKIEELFELIDKKEKNDKEKENLKTLLKEKILDSAIHGELVENDLTLQAVDVEETKEDVPFDIPNNWKWSHIENCVQINPRNKINDEIFVGFVPMTNILGGYESKIVFESKKWKYVKKGYTHIKTDDVIVAKITPCFENRKSAYIKDLPSGYGAGTTEIHVLRNINNKMYMKYLLWFVKTNYFIKDGRNHFTGTAGQQRISKQWLSKFLIPVPPLEQQKKIVEKIEECFKLIEQL